MPVCPFGSRPNTDGLAQDLKWIGWTALNEAVAAPLAAIWPWLPFAYAPFLVSAANICSSSPEMPEPINVGDVLGLAVSSVLGIPISETALVKINAMVNYAAFQQLCECNPNPNGCVVQTFPLNLATNLVYVQPGLQFIWPASTHGIVQSATATFAPWVAGCEAVNITIWEGAVGSPGQPQLVSHVFDCVGQLFAQSHIMGTPIPVTLRDTGCTFTGPGFNVRWDWNVDANLHPAWTVVVAPQSGGTPTPTPPPDQPPPVNFNPPPAPPIVCDSNTLCGITWTILNQLNTTVNVNQTNTTTLLNPPSPTYTDGATFQVSDQGEQAVASGTRALRVELLSWPPPLDPRPTVPPDFFDVGWVVTGSGAQWDRKTWIRRTPQFIQPLNQPLTQFSWDLASQVTISVTELL